MQRALTRVLIAGCGYVGTALGRVLSAQGCEVWALKRNPATLPAPLRPIAADLRVPSSLAALPQAIDTVFYTAAADNSSEQAYREAYLDGLNHLLTALQQLEQQGSARPARILFTSSTSVYGQDQGQWVDETSVTSPQRQASLHLLAAEQLLRTRWPQQHVIVRFSGIYGPGRTRLLTQVQQGQAALQAEPSSWTNRIHRDDCVGILQHLAQHDQPATCYLASDNEPVRYNEVVCWLAQQCGVAQPPPAAAAPFASSATQPQLHSSRTSGLNKRCRNELLLATGYGLRYPTFREGYTALSKTAPS